MSPVPAPGGEGAWPTVVRLRRCRRPTGVAVFVRGNVMLWEYCICLFPPVPVQWTVVACAPRVLDPESKFFAFPQVPALRPAASPRPSAFFCSCPRTSHLRCSNSGLPARRIPMERRSYRCSSSVRTDRCSCSGPENASRFLMLLPFRQSHPSARRIPEGRRTLRPVAYRHALPAPLGRNDFPFGEGV